MGKITEDYVSFEMAKLLKEKGFDEPTIGTYYKDGTFEYLSLNKWNSKFVIPISAPTLQMAMKWLREVHNIAINIGWGEVFEDKFQWWCIILNQKEGRILRDSEYFNTYEQAANTAIRYCLENLI